MSGGRKLKNIEEIMSRFSKAEFNEGLKRVKDIMGTPEGQQLKNKLAGMDKRELIKKINELDSSSHSGGVGRGMSNREILDKLNQFCDRK